MTKRRQTQLRNLYQGKPHEDLIASYRVAQQVGGKTGAEHQEIIEEMADRMEGAYAYLDAHCAAFNGWTLPIAKNGYEQQCIDRGHWDGLKARERAGA